MLWTHVAAAVLAGVLAFTAGWRVRAWKADSDAAALERDAQQRTARVIERAAEASAQHELERAAILERVQRARRSTSRALAEPVRCPAVDQPPLALGDIVLRADALGGVRAAAGAASAAGDAASQPGGAVQGGPARAGH